MRVLRSYTAFKGYIVARSLIVQFAEDADNYYVWAENEPLGCDIQKGTAEATDFEGSLKLTANIAPAVSIGLVYNANLPTPASGARVQGQGNGFGEVAVQFRNKFTRLTGNATTTVKSGAGRLHGILVGDNTTGGTVTLYDNTAGSGTVIAQIQFGTPSGGLLSTSGKPTPSFLGPLGLEFATGLTAVTAGSTNNDLTVLYQ